MRLSVAFCVSGSGRLSRCSRGAEGPGPRPFPGPERRPRRRPERALHAVWPLGQSQPLSPAPRSQLCSKDMSLLKGSPRQLRCHRICKQHKAEGNKAGLKPECFIPLSLAELLHLQRPFQGLLTCTSGYLLRFLTVRLRGLHQFRHVKHWTHAQVLSMCSVNTATITIFCYY